MLFSRRNLRALRTIAFLGAAAFALWPIFVTLMRSATSITSMRTTRLRPGVPERLQNYRGPVGLQEVEVMQELDSRARAVQRACLTLKPRKEFVKGVFYHMASRVAYCFVPKTGCTFWKRVFSFLNNFTHIPVTSPWLIPRMLVHNNQHAHGAAMTPEITNAITHHLRFMFVRHPYSRLWSTYLDKIYLPDFWDDVGVKHLSKVRARDVITDKARRCGHDLTFEEFVTVSLTMYEPHWTPIYKRCDPCQFRPHVVGHMDTFSRDSLFVLRHMGLDWVLEDLDKQAQEEQELTTLIDYNFDLKRSKPSFFRHCLNDSHLQYLLWTTFQANGHIPQDIQYQPPSTTKAGVDPVEAFKAMVLTTVRQSAHLREELKQQKRQYFTQAWSSLSPKLVEKVKDKYKTDMLQFQFNDSNYL